MPYWGCMICISILGLSARPVYADSIPTRNPMDFVWAILLSGIFYVSRVLENITVLLLEIQALYTVHPKRIPQKW